MTKPAKKNEVALKPETQLPAFMQDMDMDSARGSEDVSTDDLVIPRLELCQALSPCLKKKDASYIEGIEEGDLYNNITREIYGKSVIVCPVMFKKEYLLWRDRKTDTGGFNGAYPNLAMAEEVIQTLDRPENVEAVDTHQHFCLLRKEDGTVEEIAISMARSKRKSSKNWNSLVRINGGDRFSRFYIVSSVDDKNGAGEEFQNLKVDSFGFVTEEVYRRAEALYESIKAGGVVVDRGEEGGAAEAGETIDGEGTQEF